MYPVQSYQQQYQVMEAFPYVQAPSYASKEEIIKAYPHLKALNSNRDWKNKPKLDGVVIRSANDDNVHKAIKYGVWSTTSKNRTKLSQLFTRARMENKQIYLFFSVVKSGMFEGVAKLASSYIDQNFPYWWDDFSMKFKGYFKIEWVYLKDVNYRYFEGIYSLQGEEVTKSKDCDLLDNQTTQKMLTIFDNKPLKKKWIFNDFPYMDKRERQYTRRLQQHNSQMFQYPSDYQNYNYMGTSLDKGLTNPYMGYSQMMPFPTQMMNPTQNSQFPSYSQLGFQMNPVSYKQKKK